MPLSIPPALSPIAAAVFTSFPPSLSLVGRSGLPASRELEAFLRALATVSPDAPTACDQWSAHELVAHLAAGSSEMPRLVETRIALGPGADLGPTRDFEDREQPFRALADRRLRRQFIVEGLALTDAVTRLQAAGPDVTVTFTGWDMSIDELVRHGESELVLHRWDLVGSDDVSRTFLSRPELTTHATNVLSRMGLPEGGRTPQLIPADDPADVLLQMWGRDPSWRPARTYPGG